MSREVRKALGVIGATIFAVTGLSLLLQPELLMAKDGSGPDWRGIVLLVGVVVGGVSTFVQGVVAVAGHISERKQRAPNPETEKSLRALHLVQLIQAKLHGPNGDLPEVLVLCLELCELASLPKDYVEWLNLELTGYPIEMSDERAEWMGKWGKHRLVPGYVEIWNRDPISAKKSIVQLNTDELFFSQPIPEILRIVEKAADSQHDRYETLLAGYGEAFVSQLKASLVSAGLAPHVFPDARLYFSSVALQRIPDGVRTRIVWLLNEVSRM